MPLSVLHLAGSAVDDFYADLSQLYARGCLAATADPARYAFTVASVSPDGCWWFTNGLEPGELAAAEPLTLPEAMTRITALRPDVVVPQMFCLPGMTTYRALFDLLRVPVVGNPAAVMALGADKAKARAVVAAAGVDVPPGQLVRPGETVTVRPPAVVKPVDADNSLGVTLVHDPADYDAALASAFAHSPAALVETYVPLGREVRCGVLDRDGELVVLPPEEYRVDTIRRPADKIDRSGAIRLVAKDAAHAWIVDRDDPVTGRVGDAALRCYRALGCRDYGLFDFRIDPDGRPWFLEAGLYCSFAPDSVVVTMARAAGIGLPELFADMVGRAATRRATDGP